MKQRLQFRRIVPTGDTAVLMERDNPLQKKETSIADDHFLFFFILLSSERFFFDRTDKHKTKERVNKHESISFSFSLLRRCFHRCLCDTFFGMFAFRRCFRLGATFQDTTTITIQFQFRDLNLNESIRSSLDKLLDSQSTFDGWIPICTVLPLAFSRVIRSMWTTNFFRYTWVILPDGWPL